MILPSKPSGNIETGSNQSGFYIETGSGSNSGQNGTGNDTGNGFRKKTPLSPLKTGLPVQNSGNQTGSQKYSTDFELINTFGPDTNPNNYSANQIFKTGITHYMYMGCLISVIISV